MKALSLTGIAAPILFLVVILAAGSSTPDYDHLNQFISELGASGARTATLMNYAGFIPTGVMLAIFGLVVVRRLSNDKPGYVAGACLTLFGLGVFLAGLFSCDAGCPQSGGTLSNTIHDRVSPLAFVAAIVGIGLFSFRFRRTPGWERMWIYSLATSLLAAAFFVGLVTSLESRSYTGLWQRLMLLTLFGWCASTSVRLYRMPGDGVQSAP